MRKILLLIITFLFGVIAFAQPYTEIASFTYQHFASYHKNDPGLKNKMDDYLLNLLYPKQFKNGTVFLLRLNAELLSTAVNIEKNYCSSVSSVAMPIGFQWASKSKRWKTLVMAIPKIASNFEGDIESADFQYGGLVLENYIPNENFKLKFGLYYNKEAFGDFFVPLLGVDWRATDRIYLYGTLPSNYRIEYNVVKEKAYMGLDFKWLTRSFNLTDSEFNYYMRFDEIMVKGYVDCFIYKNVLLTTQAGYSFGKGPVRYNTTTDNSAPSFYYAQLKSAPVFSFGISYRIRDDIKK